MEVSRVTSLSALPGCCRGCGSSDKEWYLDLGYNEEYYGAVAYCCDCISYLADVAGFLSPSRRQQLDDQLETRDNLIYVLRLELDGLRMVKSGLDKLGIDLGARPGDVHLDNADGPVPQDVESAASLFSAEGDDLGTGTGTTPESVDDEGVAELHADDKPARQPATGRKR